MKVVLEAIKALFRKIYKFIANVETELNNKIDAAQDTADAALAKSGGAFYINAMRLGDGSYTLNDFTLDDINDAISNGKGVWLIVIVNFTIRRFYPLIRRESGRIFYFSLTSIGSDNKPTCTEFTLTYTDEGFTLARTEAELAVAESATETSE